MRNSLASLALFALPPVLAQVPQPAPANPPPVVRAPEELARLVSRNASPAAGPVLWSVGQPTDEEQMLLELVNRTRLDPVGEVDRLIALQDPSVKAAYTYFLVDFNQFRADMGQFSPVPPLAPNAELITAARGHSQWMYLNVEQSHFQGTSDVSSRVTAVGYPWTIVGESIYAFSENPVHAHAGFEVDWGLLDGQGNPIPPGMQNPPGHRLNNHEGRFTEAGVGLVKGRNSKGSGNAISTVGPELYTINFANRVAAFPFVTGVAYFDLNANGAYDLGEGLGGVRVDVSGAGHYAVTAPSGAYAVPTASGARTVSFSAGGLTTVNRPVTVVGGDNVKADLALAYPSPTLSGTLAPPIGLVSAYQPSVVPGATQFRWAASRRRAFDKTVGAENGDTAHAEVISSPGYVAIQTQRRNTGTSAYRLTHTEGDDQILKLTPHFAGGANPQLKFSYLIGFATSGQTLTAEISDDDGQSWKAVWSKSGNDQPPPPNFTAQTISLPEVAQREFLVRFVFRVRPGSGYYNTTGSGEGVFLDSISFSDVFELNDVASGEVASGNPVPFVPPELGAYVLAVQPVVGSRVLPSGPQLLVTAVVAPPPPPVIRLGQPVLGPNGKLRLDFQRISGTGTAFVLERTQTLGTGWATDPSGVLTTNAPGSYSFRADPPAGAVGAVYRIRIP